MSAEALNQRFNAQTVTFLKTLFTHLLTQRFTHTALPFTKYNHLFNRIRSLDSTAFQLPNSFHDFYPGTGCTSIKLQLEFDLISGQFLHTQKEPGKKS